jgi:anaerobic magnesium-protoporphyrin IX monomethyl ester cyclase
MHLTLVNPQTLIQPSDPLTTGIYYFPITLASLAASLRAKGHSVTVIDAFGEAPRRVRRWRQWWMQGLAHEEVANRVAAQADGPLFIYAGNLVSHEATLEMLRVMASRFPNHPRIVVENTQAVTAYALKTVLPELFEAGATHVLTGEAEERGPRLLDILGYSTAVAANVDGVYWLENGIPHGVEPSGPIADLDALPFPAWDLFPMDNYWSLHYAHGPVTAARWLPLLTSRGCPYPCHFCVVPETNKLKWRSRSPQSVVAEMAHWRDLWGIREYHIEDLNPTVDEARMLELSRGIQQAQLAVTWKIVAGTKLDMLKDPATLHEMAKAGCRYISMSPESGSPEMLKRMGKPFKHEFALELVEKMNREGIRSQACFVVGYPEESAADRKSTRDYIHRLVKAGLDEVALFICSPVPGSAIYGQEQGYQNLSELSFSPSWRKAYDFLNRYRQATYLRFLFWKLITHPAKLLAQPFYFLTRRFHTKMEMTPYRALSVSFWRWAK